MTIFVALIMVLSLFAGGTEQTVHASQIDDGSRASIVQDTGEDGASAKAKRTILLYDCGADLETEAGMATYNLEQILKSYFSADDDIKFIVMTGGAYKWHLAKDYLFFPDDVAVPEDAVVEMAEEQIPFEPTKWEIVYGAEKSEIAGMYNQIWEARGVDAVDENGNPDKNAGKLVLLDGDGITGEGVKCEDELMSDPETLKAFINYCVENYPAEKYDLILWDHGGGPEGGFGADEHHDYDNENHEGKRIMSFTGIVDALADNKVVDSDGDGSPDSRFDFVDFDACLMSSVELALVLADYTDYYIASPESEPGYGQYYGPHDDSYIGWLDELGNPDKDALYNGEGGTFELGKVIVDDFYNFYEKDEGDGSSQDGTLAIFDTQKMIDPGTGFIDALMEFAGILKSQAADPSEADGVLFYDELKSAYNTIEYGGSDLYDLGAFAAFLGVVNSEISTKDLNEGYYRADNAYKDISKKINTLLGLQDTDPENAFMYASGTSGIRSSENYYRTADGSISYGDLGTSGLSIFFPYSYFAYNGMHYMNSLDSVLETMPEDDPRTIFFKEYEKVVAYYNIIFVAARNVNNVINPHMDVGLPKEEVTYDYMMEEWQGDYGNWDSIFTILFDYIGLSDDEIDS